MLRRFGGEALAFLLGVAALVAAQGSLNYAVARAAPFLGLDATWIGLATGLFFAGQALGALLAPLWLAGRGTVPTWVGAALLVVVVALGHQGSDSGSLWLLLRLVDGTAFAVLLVASESWLATRSRPGPLLAAYTAIYFVALGLGQVLVGWIGLAGIFPVAALFGLAAILPIRTGVRPTRPTGATGRVLPRPHWPVVPAAAAAGMVLGVVYGFGPGLAADLGLGEGQAALWFGSLVVLAGAVQWPLVRAADRFGPAAVTGAGLSLCGVGTAAVAWGGTDALTAWLALLLATGAAAALYPLGVWRAVSDHGGADAPAMGSGVLLATAFGSALGPSVAGLLATGGDLAAPFAVPALVCGAAGLAQLAQAPAVWSQGVRLRRRARVLRWRLQRRRAGAPRLAR